jgi:hypothetical protein
MRTRSLLQFIAGWIVVMLGHSDLTAQVIPVEIMSGNRNYLYQHYFSKKIDESNFSFFHTSSLYAYYNQDGKTEIMSQSYITYGLNPNIKLAVGTFYASKPGFKPAAAIHLIKKTKDLFIMLVPRIDLWSNMSAEAMMLVEYRPVISKHVNLYSKVQMMSNYGPRHNRSYQNFRAGLDINTTQFGLALNVDEFGNETITSRNWGLFLRHEF